MTRNLKSRKLLGGNILVLTLILAAVLGLVLLFTARKSQEPEGSVPAAPEVGVVDGGGTPVPADKQADDEIGDNSESETDQASVPQETYSAPAELPRDWHQLTPKEKILLNPFNCPSDANGIVHMSSETGRCLETPNSGGQTNPRGTLSLGEAFTYDKNSEVTVDTLNCEVLSSINFYPYGINLTLSQFLEKNGAEYERYRRNPRGLRQEYFTGAGQLGHLTYFDYLDNFERYLVQEYGQAAGSLATQLGNYLDCEVTVTMKNIGPETYFPDACELDFSQPLSLVGRARTYRHYPGQAIFCAAVVVPFPTGATSSDTVSFIVEAKDKILEVRVRGPSETFRILLD